MQASVWASSPPSLVSPFNPIPDETVSLTGANVRFEGSTAPAVSSLAVFGAGAPPFPLLETQTDVS